MSRKPIKALIVAAYHKELAPFCRLGSKHFVIKRDVAYLAAGIGPVAAAFGLTHFLEDYRPEMIVGIGTAGVINPKLKIGDVVVGKLISPNSAQKIISTISRPLCPFCPHSPEWPQVNIFAPQEISRTEAQRMRLQKAGYDVENLEAYAFAFVAKIFRVPFVSLLGLTNHVGPKGHEEWVRNEKKMCQKLDREIKKQANLLK